ncbi:hypothetical protein BOTBODRAFT_113350 [Botryobasidium botryosum FD-172 SS1]|uniref:KANL3/Tex30 alpha/beta hydrolase-like domain-containing protein n=1 Tax=Botryobasidium botryosum (strain FD-172 SS1) TaxID=930990 RepID=A0A067MKK8_BOTB1|nr:hypothetical protein BOTBODRAFT_113350 [Botryobasidium botryosum FD-172 SS1]
MVFLRACSDRLRRAAFALALAAPANAPRARHQSTLFLLRSPAPSAPREVPTPLVVLSSGRWEKDSAKGMKDVASMFAERGYTTLEIDLAPPQVKPTTSQSLMKYYEDELVSHIRLAAIPFAPLLIARSAAGALIAQTYISSHPASGLILLSPPTSNASSSTKSLLPAHLKEFDYEPRFPLLIVDTPAAEQAQQADNRLVQEGADLKIVGDLDGQECFTAMEKWMDEIGV